MAVQRPSGAHEYRMQSRINPRAVLRDDLQIRELADTKPNTMSSNTVPIVVGITVPLAAIVCALLYLWRRNLKRQRAEDAKDPHQDLDFGLDASDMPIKKKNGRVNVLMTEKSAHKNGQLSMDMNLESPYLLPPQAVGSTASIDTLTRGYPQEYDPYRMVNSEVGSIRSFNKEGSMYGGSSKRASVITGRSMNKPPTHQGSFPKSPIDDLTPVTTNEKDPFATPISAPEPVHHGRAPELQEPIIPVEPVVPEIGTIPYPDDVQQPSRAASKSPEDQTASPPRQSRHFSMPRAGPRIMDNSHLEEPLPLPKQPDGAGLGLNLDIPNPTSPIDETMFGHGQTQHQPMTGQIVDPNDNRRSKESDYGYHEYNPQIQTSEYYEDVPAGGYGHLDQREQPAQPMEQPQPRGLGVPQSDNKRLSVGFRPLPPDEITESEDPEYRANRIRSFYKEYFDDSKEVAPPMPSVPHVPNDYYTGGGAYQYEEYDDQYLGDAAYFDPDTNAFVMPGAQPVHRRAMTPPPAGRRGPPGPGPRGPPGGRPRGPGSIGGMSLQGAPRPRAGSAAYGSRAGSSWGPRPDSSASARGRGPPKKKLPPPSALSTLPTPSKLKDDSFAIFNAADFAPPESFGSRARGRSQSPLGERRPYSPAVPSASPLVTSYDELNVLPSPHLMRKSGTFDNLDFLPPKKFKDQDNMSDAGSIRSNRSGISSTAQSAIRMGAGRVSKLPGDEVFTKHAMGAELKPQWGMRA